MAKNWESVAAAMRERLTELDMTQAELVQRADVAPMTVRELLFNSHERRRSRRTLAAISRALQWPSDHLALVLEGTASSAQGQGTEVRPGASTINRLCDEVADLQVRLAALEAERKH